MGASVKSLASWGQFGGAQKTIQAMGLSTDEAMIAGGSPLAGSTLRGKADGPSTYQANAPAPTPVSEQATQGALQSGIAPTPPGSKTLLGQ